MFQPVRIGSLELVNRVVVSPMDMYVAVDGLASDFHLVHLGGKALGGAGLVMTEMVCVSPEGRITPGCAGLWDDEQQAAWRRVTDFVHTNTPAKIGLQLGHSGGKGSTKLMWEGIDEPLDEGNWEVVAPSPVPYREGVNQVPRELTRAEMDTIRDQFVESARRGAEAGFDLLELHCAHGYLLSAFLSPVTNRRTDAYGGDVTGRLRYPLEVFAAMREVWPADQPMTVRISATDWVEDGQTLDDALEVARAFVDAGAAAIDVSTGQVTARRAAGVRPVLPDAVRRRDPQPARRAHHRGRRDLVVRRRELDPAGRPRRPLRHRPRPPLRPDRGPCTPRSSRTTTARARRGRCRGGPAAASRRPAGPTGPSRGSS